MEQIDLRVSFRHTQLVDFFLPDFFFFFFEDADGFAGGIEAVNIFGVENKGEFSTFKAAVSSA